MKKNILLEKTFAFAVRCVKLYKYLVEEKKEFVMSKQMLKAGTSVGANSREARSAESRMDFVHKLGIVRKECDETMFWFEVLYATEYIDKKMFESIYADAEEILKIVNSTILTTKGTNKQ